ncbi:MAG TPA: hypothetical protein GXX29_08490 [Firmicutes bacterium]|nr:hypothetical protein [Bacillota bacterium]
MNHIRTSEIVLSGLDGGNPLAFLAALGATITATAIWPETLIYWQLEVGGWRPVLVNCESDKEVFLQKLHAALKEASMTVFDLDDKLPFAAEKFIAALRASARQCTPSNRREADFLTGMGTDMYPEQEKNKIGVFQDTSLRMVRSGDSNGQGLPAYAKAIRQITKIEHLDQALFQQWDYRDGYFSLRWDPIEDQRYALRWDNPSNSEKKIVIGANSLAIEALQLLPTAPVGTECRTTGFHDEKGRGTFFTWPIWTVKIGINTIRSLLAYPGLHQSELPHEDLSAMGVAAVYRSQRIRPNQYYSNFAPPHPV